MAGRSWDLSALRYIMNGGEPIKPSVANAFLRLLGTYGLPPTAMYPGWGMSETTAGVVDCQYSATGSADDRYVAVGRPHPGVRT
jgi:acyl-CoA synthetase (AMP-forming)/AMP-acid ligase II